MEIIFCGVLAPKHSSERKALAPGTHKDTSEQNFLATAKAVKAFSSVYEFVPRCTRFFLFAFSSFRLRGMMSVCWKVLANLELDQASSHLVCCTLFIRCRLNSMHMGENQQQGALAVLCSKEAHIFCKITFQSPPE